MTRESIVDGVLVTNLPPEHKAEATLDQANPVQNTWYTVLDSKDYVRIYLIGAVVQVADETVEGKITIDGQTILITGVSFTAAAQYIAMWKKQATATASLKFQATGREEYRAGILIEGRSVKVEIRKTTALGAGNLEGLVVYAQYN